MFNKRYGDSPLQEWDARRLLKAAEEARKALSDMGDAAIDAEALAAADRAVSLASERYDMRMAKDTADAAYASWGRAEAIASVLAPDGVRRTVMLRNLEAFNADLALVGGLAGWPWPRISEDFSIRADEDLYEDHSRSRQWRIRLMLQVACARADGSSMVVADELDLLDVPSRPQALKLLKGCGLPAVVAMTTTPAKAVDLRAAGFGETVVIDRGESRPIGSAAPAT